MVHPLRVGLVGSGVFGSYHAGKIAAASAVQFIGIFDPDSARCAALASKHGVLVYQSIETLFAACDAVIIATPAASHSALVAQALDAGCHVLVEKPLALKAREAFDLADRADRLGLVLQVGHQERLVCRTLGLFDIDEQPNELTAIRAGPPPLDGRAMDVSVIWDLMIHDIDLVHCLFGQSVPLVSAKGTATLGDAIDQSEATLVSGKRSIRLIADRTAQERRRELSLIYPSGTVTVDFLSRNLINTTPFSLNGEFAEDLPDPLGAADEAFFAACQGDSPCLVPGLEAALAVATAEKLETLALN
ncbi:MAG: Gfo/Idh/MocA family oxidoreductase [Pseudomonadota bacterium]